MSVTGFVNEDELAGGWICDGLGEPVGELTSTTAELDEGVSVLKQAGLVKLTKKTRILD